MSNTAPQSDASSAAQPLGYTPAELATRLGKHPSTVYRLIYAGKLRVCRSFGSLFIPHTEVAALLSDVSVFTPTPKNRTKECAETPEVQVA
jgi:excisionase family DNA binding protein